jgi:hypothetical protein
MLCSSLETLMTLVALHMVQWSERRRHGYARRFMSEAVRLPGDAADLKCSGQPQQRLRAMGGLIASLLFLLGVQLHSVPQSKSLQVHSRAVCACCPMLRSETGNPLQSL